MTTIASADVNIRLGELLDRVAQGESIAITEAGKPVALLVPPHAVAATPDAEDGKPEIRNIAKEMLAYRDQQKRTLGEGVTFRDLMEEGRR